MVELSMLALLAAAREPVAVGALGNALTAGPDEVLLELMRGLEERGLVELEEGPPPIEVRGRGFPPEYEEFLLSEPKTAHARITEGGRAFLLEELRRAQDRVREIHRGTADVIRSGDTENFAAAYYLRGDPAASADGEG